MAKRAPTKMVQEASASLVVSRANAERKISDRIDLGKELLSRSIKSWDDFRAAQMEFFTWSEFNRELLKRLFTSEELYREYNSIGVRVVSMRTRDLQDEIQGFHKEVSIKIRRLESVKNRLELIPEPVLREEHTTMSEPARKAHLSPLSFTATMRGARIRGTIPSGPGDSTDHFARDGQRRWHDNRKA